MGMMERDGDDFDAGLNTMHANANRAKKLGWDTDSVLNFKGKGAGYGWFQPLDEPRQLARVKSLIQHPHFSRYVSEAEKLVRGEAEDRVGGATHYLSHPRKMVELSGGVYRAPDGTVRTNSRKYSSWPTWTGYDPDTGQYRNQTFADKSHAFLDPDAGSAPPSTSVRGRAPEDVRPQPARVVDRSSGGSGLGIVMPDLSPLASLNFKTIENKLRELGSRQGALSPTYLGRSRKEAAMTNNYSTNVPKFTGTVGSTAGLAAGINGALDDYERSRKEKERQDRLRPRVDGSVPDPSGEGWQTTYSNAKPSQASFGDWLKSLPDRGASFMQGLGGGLSGDGTAGGFGNYGSGNPLLDLYGNGPFGGPGG